MKPAAEVLSLLLEMKRGRIVTYNGSQPVREMLRQPGVSFVKEDGLPLGSVGISLVEASIGEDFPGQRFMLFPGDNEFLVCPARKE